MFVDIKMIMDSSHLMNLMDRDDETFACVVRNGDDKIGSRVFLILQFPR
jgi:hypothetical protein